MEMNKDKKLNIEKIKAAINEKCQENIFLMPIIVSILVVTVALTVTLCVNHVMTTANNSIAMNTLYDTSDDILDDMTDNQEVSAGEKVVTASNGQEIYISDRKAGSSKSSNSKAGDSKGNEAKARSESKSKISKSTSNSKTVGNKNDSDKKTSLGVPTGVESDKGPEKIDYSKMPSGTESQSNPATNNPIGDYGTATTTPISGTESGAIGEVFSYAGFASDGSIASSGMQQPSDTSYYIDALGQSVATSGVIFDGTSLPGASFSDLSPTAQETISSFDPANVMCVN